VLAVDDVAAVPAVDGAVELAEDAPVLEVEVEVPLEGATVVVPLAPADVTVVAAVLPRQMPKSHKPTVQVPQSRGFPQPSLDGPH